MMLLDRPKKYINFEIDGGSCHFLDASDSIEVSTYAFRTKFEPYENSWGIMVTLQTPRNSAAKETSLLTSSRFLWRTSGSTNHLHMIGWAGMRRTSTISIYTIH